MPNFAPLSNHLGKLFFLLLILCLATVGPNNAEEPYEIWSMDEAREQETKARKVLKENPNSLQALDLLARSLSVQWKHGELPKVLERSYNSLQVSAEPLCLPDIHTVGKRQLGL